MHYDTTYQEENSTVLEIINAFVAMHKDWY